MKTTFALHSMEQLEAENAALRKELDSLKSYKLIDDNVILREQLREARLQKIVMICAEAYGVTVKEVMSIRRTQNIAWARQLAMEIIYRIGEMTLSEVGNYFGGRDHGTVIHAIKSVRQRSEWRDERTRINRARQLCEIVTHRNENQNL